MHTITGPLLRRETWLSVAYLLLAAPLGVLWLVLVVTGLGLGAVTAVLGVGLPMLLGTLLLAREAADLDRRLVNGLLGGRIPAPAPPHPGVRGLLAGRRTWRSLAWVVLRGIAGLAVLAAAVAAALTVAALLAVPFVDGYLRWGATWRSSAGPHAIWTLPVALAVAVALLHLAAAGGAVHRRAAGVLLGPDGDERVAVLQAEAGVLQEQALVARELHDGIGHALSIMVLQAEAARVQLGTDAAAADRTLRTIGATGRRALSDLDAVLGALHGDDAPPSGPAPALESLPELLDRARSAGLPVRVTVDDADAAAGHPAGGLAYRIVQEACTNALRHAGRVLTVVSISTASGALVVEIRSDPGVPDDPLPAGGGRGLAGLAERVRMAGGQWSAGPEPGGRWLVSARLPAPGTR